MDVTENKSTPTRTGYFGELADLRESELDGANFVVRGVTLIRPGFSSNTDKAGRPRYYPAATLRAAASVFEGTRAFLNHPSKSQAADLPERSVADIAGYYENVRAADDGRLTADLRIVGAAQATVWPLIVETVERKPGLVDLSINALGTTKLGEAEGRKAVIVEGIVGANSVDIVTTGAAGGTFAGALLQSDGDAWTGQLLAALSFDEWREARPEFVGQLKGEWKTTRETSALAEARAKITQLETDAAALSEQNRASAAELADLRRAALADRLLSESTLPFTLRGQVRGELLEQAEQAGMERVIERARATWHAAARAPVPVAGAGQRTAQAPTTPSAPRPNAAAVLMGISESTMPKAGESAEQYRARRLREAPAA